MNAQQPETELANTCRSAHAVQDSLSWHGRTQIRAETGLLAGRRIRRDRSPDEVLADSGITDRSVGTVADYESVSSASDSDFLDLRFPAACW